MKKLNKHEFALNKQESVKMWEFIITNGNPEKVREQVLGPNGLKELFQGLKPEEEVELLIMYIKEITSRQILPGEGICPECESIYNISYGCCNIPGIPDELEEPEEYEYEYPNRKKE